MKPIILCLLMLFLAYSCKEERMDYFELGRESYEKGNYTLAKSQFSSIKPEDISFEKAKFYIFKIDSIEFTDLKNWTKKDSLQKGIQKELFEKHKGTYRVRISKSSSSEYGDIYVLKEQGVAIWEWANFYDSNTWSTEELRRGSWRVTDSTITIDIMGNSEMISEVFILRDGYFKNQGADSFRWLQKVTK